MKISRTQLQYRYSWSAYRHDDPRLRGAPDSVLLNRAEGYEVIAFLEHFIANAPWSSPPGLDDVLKAERLIQHAVPGNLRSRAAIYEWIVDNWSRH